MKLPRERKDIPTPLKWTRLAGPGAIMVATSLGSGEIHFWPNMSVQIGTWVLLFGLAAIGIEYVINTEVSRYTLTTGETIIQGFQRLAGFLPWVVLACCSLPWVWPGWAMGGATAMTWLVGANETAFGVASLIVTGLMLSFGRTLYRTLEITQMIMISLTIVVALSVFVITGAWASSSCH